MAAEPGSEHGPLRVGLDLSALISGFTGVSRYARMHLAELRRRADVEVHGFAIGRGAAASEPGVVRSTVPLRVVHRAWRTLRWPAAEHWTGPVDVVHSIDMVPPPSKAPLVITVHDALPLTMPETFGPRFVRVHEGQRRLAARAAVIVTTCEATADELVRVGYGPRERIVVAPPGTRDFSGAAEPVIEGPYVFGVGLITPRKGFQILIEAASRLGSACPPILIAGPDSYQADEVRSAVERFGMADRVQFLGYLDDTTLERYIRNATVFCHPSVAEGFGIPCVEAMALGAPVLAADIPPVREIGAGAIELVPPGDPAALAAGLEALLGDPTRRAALVERGRVRATDFSWRNMTDQIVAAYRMASPSVNQR